MKGPLEPIPAEQQIVTLKRDTSQDGLRPAGGGGMMNGVDTVNVGVSVGRPHTESGQLDKAYPWLLGVSTCLSALLCWMYVTKPVIIPDRSPVVASAEQESHRTEQEPVVNDGADSGLVEGSLIPSDSRLPSGSEKPVASQGVEFPLTEDPKMLNPAQLDAREQGVAIGWEKTNLKVQHILSADTGSGKNEKVVVNVPVLYESRSMRWTPEKIEKAREVLARLMVYERNLGDLRKEGGAILAEWNQIIEETVPASSLRADSPSLPYNQNNGSAAAALPDSSSLIQVEDK